ncbi:hypothetical protein [Emticicia sp. TH156]|uniref:hypothetical protein n=1 Tax=Emticicia sp. TH156 TaxID=2067454 RepID=UPI000C77A48E|nr:hypothetical protein [Emticicia sp. TH156]PLK44892.1 hypothetical protein C0V77_06485 [Emticicia sp. TH156]
MKFILYILVGYSFLSCRQVQINNQAETDFEGGITIGKANNPILNEISGMVVSKRNKGMFWVHNDSGDINRIFLIDSLAQIRTTFYLKDIENRDWEDIAITSINGETWLYLADIGDNQAIYDTKYIYRFKEPSINDIPLIENIEKVSFQYPDGNRDAEALLIDHSLQKLYIVSKREEKKRLYEISFIPKTMQTANFLGELDFSVSNSNMPSQFIQGLYIVAGDISLDNKEILIKNYMQIFYWKRRENETLLETLNRTPKQVPYIIEPQGEAIAFHTEGKGYYTISEANSDGLTNIIYYKKK